MSPGMNPRLPRISALLCLAALLASGMPGSALLPRQAAAVDIVVDAGSIWVEPSHPEVGDTVKVSASVWNNAQYDTSVVDVFFWDGSPSLNHLIGSMQQGIDPQQSQLFYTSWDTTSLLSGFHDVWVTANPTDFPDPNLGNNNASR